MLHIISTSVLQTWDKHNESSISYMLKPALDTMLEWRQNWCEDDN